MTSKQQVIASIQRLPDDCTMEDIEYNVFVLAKMNASENSVERGDVHSHEQVVEMMKQRRQQTLLGLPTR